MDADDEVMRYLVESGPTATEQVSGALRAEVSAAGRRGSAVSKHALAHQLSVSLRSVYAYLNGETLIPEDVLERFVELLGVSPGVARRLRDLRRRALDDRRSRRRTGQDEKPGIPPCIDRRPNSILPFEMAHPPLVDRHFPTTPPWTTGLDGRMGTLFRRGVIERIIGEYEWAAVSFGVAFEAASKGANPLAEMNCRSYLGTVHRIALEHSEAFDQLSVALDGYRRLQSRRGQAHTLLQLGILYRQQVRYAEAEQAMTAALTYYTGLRDFHDAAGVLLELGVLHRLSTDSTAALRLLDRALIVYEALGSRQGQSNVLYEIQARDRSTQPPAIVQPVLEYPSTSDTVEWFETTMAEWHSRGNHGSRLWGLRHYAAIAADTPTARDYLRRSIELALVLDSPWEASEAHRDLFDLDRHRRRPPRKNTCAIRLNPAESGSLPLLRAPYICDGSIQINSGSRTMANSLTKRTAAILCGLIATTAAMVAAGEPAQAASGGGCQGPGYANVCIGMDTGNIAYAGHTNYTTGTCTIHLMLWDYSAQAGGVPVFTKDFRCGSGQIDYRPAVLSNPTTGHDYKAEMRVDWGNSKVDTYLSPDLIA